MLPKKVNLAAKEINLVTKNSIYYKKSKEKKKLMVKKLKLAPKKIKIVRKKFEKELIDPFEFSVSEPVCDVIVIGAAITQEIPHVTEHKTEIKKMA